MDSFSFVVGLAVGVGLTIAITWNVRKTSTTRDDLILEKVKESFGAATLQAISHIQQQGNTDVDNKKALIDGTLKTMKDELIKVENLMKSLENDRSAKFGEINAELKRAVEETRRLSDTTTKLETVIGGTKSRGQWGERIADDILRMIGFVEGINYLRQKEETSEDDEKKKKVSRPDYTFFLPSTLRVNMDVKFPMSNYLKYIEADDEARAGYKSKFLADVRARIKEVTSREYINTKAGTIDCAIVFIPNEQIYEFINSEDREIIDYALANRIILSSPNTLFALLSVIRHSVDNFHMQEKASVIRDILVDFIGQWNKFKVSMDKMGKSLEQAHGEFVTLSTTRSNMLEKPLLKIKELKQEDSDIVEITPLLPENSD